MIVITDVDKLVLPVHNEHGIVTTVVERMVSVVGDGVSEGVVSEPDVIGHLDVVV